MSEINSSRMSGTRIPISIGNIDQESINETSNESCEVSEPGSTNSKGLVELQQQLFSSLKEDNLKALAFIFACLSPSKPITRKTINLYFNRGKRLLKQYQKFIGASGLPMNKLNPVQFLEYICLQKLKLTENSWLLNRKSALVIIPLFTGISVMDGAAILFADEKLFSASSETEEHKSD